ncbi:MAG: membrane dipeptidase, partial [Chitinophagaceae bacterium]|nr:membrane dipeptidase [Chitinophagaceae bacterium]
MRSIALLAISFLTFSIADAQSNRKLHFKSIVIDTHNDIPTTAIEKNVAFDTDLKGKTHSDLNRFGEAGVDIQIFSIWCDGVRQQPYQIAHRQIDSVYEWANRNPKRMMMVYNSRDIHKAVRRKKFGAMLGVEGGHMIENDLAKLDTLFNRGVRYMTLTWNNSTPWATSALDETSRLQSRPSEMMAPERKKGLNDFGKSVVKRMNELGMLVDLSHVGEQTFWDAINTTTKPVVVSHSCVHALCPVFRNLKDDQIRAVGKNGGVIHLNFFSGFVDSNFFRRTAAFNARHKKERDSVMKTVTDPYFADIYLFEKYPDEVTSLRPPLSMLLDHLDYIVKLIGPNHVGLGSDFDGINSSPQQLDDVTSFPLITDQLIKRGYSKKDIQKILGHSMLFSTANYIYVDKE